MPLLRQVSAKTLEMATAVRVIAEAVVAFASAVLMTATVGALVTTGVTGVMEPPLFVFMWSGWATWALERNDQRQRVGRPQDTRLATELPNRIILRGLASLPLVLWQQMGEEECSVCYEAFAEGQTLRLLPCGHRFHRDCADRWLLTVPTCPYCRRLAFKG